MISSKLGAARQNKTGPDRQGVAALARGIVKVQQVCMMVTDLNHAR